jgi:predicted nucleic acid-binding protein
MYLLSAGICAQALRAKNDNYRLSDLTRQFQKHSLSEMAVCSVAIQELLFQARTSQKSNENLQLVRSFLAPMVNLPFDERCAEEAALLRVQVDSGSVNINSYDLLNVAVARAHDAILVVGNADDYRPFVGVDVEVW